MHLNLVAVLLISTVWVVADDSREEEKKKWITAFMDCTDEAKYNITVLMEKLENKEKFCPDPAEEPKIWATCLLKKLGAMDDDKNYINTFFPKICKTDDDRKNMTVCEKRLESENITPDMRACTIIDCMTELDVKSIYEDDDWK